nr:uncharacterized protein LOC120973248 [Aegilops tauschii subsp. strangulata]
MTELYSGAIKLDAVVFFLGERRPHLLLLSRPRKRPFEPRIDLLLDVFFPCFLCFMDPKPRQVHRRRSAHFPAVSTAFRLNYDVAETRGNAMIMT